MPAPNRLLHASLAVTDLDRAREFYGRLLALPEVERPPFARPGIRYEIGGVQLHVMIGEPHAAFRVDDPATARGALETFGPPVRELTQSPDGRHHVFVKDPAGNMVEFVGPLPSEKTR